MKKRIVIGVCLSLVILVAAGVAWRQYAYWHPAQSVYMVHAPHARYPGIMYQGIDRDIPPVLRDQMEEFNEEVGTFVLDLQLKYGDGLELDYELEHDKSGTSVIFSGQGIEADGTVTEIHKELHFDIVIRKDAKWN